MSSSRKTTCCSTTTSTRRHSATKLQEFAKREFDREFPYLYGLATMKLHALTEAS
jgi:hypothetical protein